MTITLAFGSGNGHILSHLGNRIDHFIGSNSLVVYCTTPRKLVVYAPMGAQPLRSCVPFNGRAVSYHSQQWHDVTITALRISVDLRDLLAHRNCFVNEIRVTLWSCALAIFSQEGGKIKCYSNMNPRYEILINRLQFRWYSRCCTTQMANGFDLCNGTIFRIRWKIDVLFNSASPPPPPPGLRLVE